LIDYRYADFMKSVQWKRIPEFDNYFASQDGKVKKVVINEHGIKEVILKKRTISGYDAFSLIHKNGKSKTVYLHRILAVCFLPAHEHAADCRVVHLDGNKTNNAIENLAWMSPKAFIQREFELGKRSNAKLWKKRVRKYGAHGGNLSSGKRSPLTNQEKKNILELYQKGHITMRQLAEK
jgi:hypothetical protein